MTVELKIGLDAGQMKDILRTRHPAQSDGTYVGRWTCLEEWANIDLLALDAWQDAAVIGYEVKVSRSDLRSELLHPEKRMEAVSRCTRFYIAVPHGLLSKEELAFREPKWTFDDFKRERCPGISEADRQDGGHRRLRLGGQCVNPRHDRNGKVRKSKYISKPTDPYTGEELPKGFLVRVPIPAVIKPSSFRMGHDDEADYSNYEVQYATEQQGYKQVRCPTCGGKGHLARSKVENEWPMLWVPNDVGLIEVYASGVTRIVRESPKNLMPKSIIGLESWDSPRISEDRANRGRRQAIADIVRWASNRPDPRHR